MLRSLKELYGNKLGASNGEIGQIKDIYFDDQNWAIRYLVADTGAWLTGRKVLISPHSLARLAASGQVVKVGLTRRQIENSPSIDTQKPVSRQYEEEYHKYYGWPGYWKDAKDFVGPQPPREVHLRSTQAVSGYLVRVGDETIGHICDFMMDAESWTIGQLVVKTGHRISGKDMSIPTKQVHRVSYADSTVFAHATVEAAEQVSANTLVPAGVVL
jgi:sporulation protein YlmC with PRC-barrel domain